MQLNGSYSSKLVLLTLTVILLTTAVSGARKSTRKRVHNKVSVLQCNEEKCKLPDCRCSGLPYPKKEFKGREKEIPQFVTVTFDDAVNAINYAEYQEVFKDLVNPDKCKAVGTFFVSHEYTDYVKVNALYNEGHEIAVHSVTHGTGQDYWRNITEDRMTKEFGNEIDILEEFAKIDPKYIEGMRLPYLQIKGNMTYSVGKSLGLTYDASWPTQTFRDIGMWPYTLDYPSVQDCTLGPCPTAPVPGFWVQPMTMWTDLQGFACSMIDACAYKPEDEVDDIFDWFLDNFNRHYEGIRTPFGMYVHASWFNRGDNHLAAFRKFLEHINTYPDVYIVNAARVIEYMKQPVLGKPFKNCNIRPHVVCSPRSCSVVREDSAEARYLSVCDQCPEVYPWLDNPLGEALEYTGNRRSAEESEESEEKPKPARTTRTTKAPRAPKVPRAPTPPTAPPAPKAPRAPRPPAPPKAPTAPKTPRTAKSSRSSRPKPQPESD